MSQDDKNIAELVDAAAGVFTYGQPIASSQFLKGRDSEIADIVLGLSNPGVQVLLFGDRGVGKSSVARVAADLFASSRTYKCLYYTCNPQDSFLEVVDELLDELHIRTDVTEINREKGEGGEAGAGVGPFKAKVDTSSSTTVTSAPEHARLRPSWLRKRLQDKKWLYVIDEIDSVVSVEAVHQVAVLIKQLSDHGATFKVLLVGVARTTSQLLRGHPSSDRPVGNVHLKRLSDEAIREIPTEGASRLLLPFDEDVVEEIVRLTRGFAYYAQLLSYFSAVSAARGRRRRVRLENLREGVTHAGKHSATHLGEIYGNAIEYDEAGPYAALLDIAVELSESDINIGALYNQGRKRVNGFSEPLFKRFLSQVCSKRLDSTKVFLTVNDHHIVFRDPRMPTHIKLRQARA